MYLSANLFHKPKFPDLGIIQTLQLYFLRSSSNKKLQKNVQIARNKLNKDLDITTYLRTVNKVKGIVQCSLDDKQRMMLKYNHHRMITQQPTSYKAELPNKGESIIGTANVIYDKFAEAGKTRSDADLRYLLGLGNTWGNLIPEEFKVKQTPKPPKQRPSQPQQPQNANMMRQRMEQTMQNDRYSNQQPQNGHYEPQIQPQNTRNRHGVESNEINKTIEDFQ